MSPPSPATARPRAPRLLAIPPPSGAVALACIDAWLDAGAPEAGLAVLLREPGATPAALLDAHGRLAPLRRRCRDLGIPLLLGCDADALAALFPDDAEGRSADLRGSSVLAAQRSSSSPAPDARGHHDVDRPHDTARRSGLPAPDTLAELAGVQLRGDPSPLALADARARLPPAWILGRSCHGHPTGAHALVDYTCLAPIFPPTTPQPGVEKTAIGLERLAAWASEPDAHLIALGGVGPANAAACLQAGARALAGIGLFFGAPARIAQDVAAVVTALQARDVQPLPPGQRP